MKELTLEGLAEVLAFHGQAIEELANATRALQTAVRQLDKQLEERKKKSHRDHLEKPGDPVREKANHWKKGIIRNNWSGSEDNAVRAIEDAQ